VEGVKAGAVVIFGATSGIARPVADILAAQGDRLILIGRGMAALEAMAREFAARHGRKPAILVWDVLDHKRHAEKFAALCELAALSAAQADPGPATAPLAQDAPGTPEKQGIQGIFFAAGTQFLQEDCEADPEKTRITMDTNLTGPAIILDLFAGHFRNRGSGWISCVSSVAGERGRGKVLAYGASKAGLTAYLAGLRHRLAGSGVFVQTIKPGFVRTRMTAGMTSPLMAEPDSVARDITSALRKRREVIYTPWMWKWIMLIIRNMPSPIFRRMKF